MDEILNTLEEVKKKLTDAEYMSILNSLKKINENIKNFYNFKIKIGFIDITKDDNYIFNEALVMVYFYIGLDTFNELKKHQKESDLKNILDIIEISRQDRYYLKSFIENFQDFIDSSNYTYPKDQELIFKLEEIGVYEGNYF